LVGGQSIRSISEELGLAPSTVSREIKRNGESSGYRASQADQATRDRAYRPKICKLADNWDLAQIVAEKLKLQWSPEQIARRLKRAYSGNEAYQVSHETIYRRFFQQNSNERELRYQVEGAPVSALQSSFVDAGLNQRRLANAS
jgi:IS30 family transposase